MNEELQYQIALTLIEGVGDVHAKSLLAYCGSASAVFRHSKGQLSKIPGIGEYVAGSVKRIAPAMKRAEEEIRFIQKFRIKPLFFTDDEYPGRLRYCNDSPILLYYKGNADLNTERIVAVVGTRKPSAYGIEKTTQLLADLRGSGILVVSGLAYGVDVLAHKTALENNLETVGVIGHGLDRIYPQTHDKIAKRMIKQGGLLTDFLSGTEPDAVNFPKRNRIVAGICDALIVVESKRTGGSLITATIANSYNKDVFAFPGRAGEVLAEGCNGLIKRNRASLIENAEDLLYCMQWQKEDLRKSLENRQIPLLLKLTEEQKPVMELFSGKKCIHVDEICQSTQLSVSKVSGILLQLEFNNLIRSKPGKMYELM